ncbi:MAG: glycosyltransferase family 2 protein [Chloroflexi bacterium]|nr:glycosyltransferase family 2 protein [Chloroflexota bacterium]
MLFDTPSQLGADPRQWRICVVLPTRDEAATLEAVVEELRAAFRECSLREPVVIITDDSHDGTRAIARRLGVHVVAGGGKGLGFAMQQGLKAALAFEPDVIMSADADAQSDPREVLRFLAPLASGEADMVVGSRFLEPGLVQFRYRWTNRLGTIILAQMLRRITGLPLTDSHGGLRALRPEVARALDIIGAHTYVQESIIDAHEKGFRVKEVPSTWRPRLSGSSKVVGSIPKYIMYTLPVLIVRSGVHVRWLYTAAFLLIVAALGYFLLVAWQEGFNLARMFLRLPAFTLIAVMIMVGTQLFTLGFLAEILGVIKLRVDRLAKSWPDQPVETGALPSRRADAPLERRSTSEDSGE